jgi:hypothetical protein
VAAPCQAWPSRVKRVRVPCHARADDPGQGRAFRVEEVGLSHLRLGSAPWTGRAEGIRGSGGTICRLCGIAAGFTPVSSPAFSPASSAPHPSGEILAASPQIGPPDQSPRRRLAHILPTPRTQSLDIGKGDASSVATPFAGCESRSLRRQPDLDGSGLWNAPAPVGEARRHLQLPCLGSPPCETMTAGATQFFMRRCVRQWRRPVSVKAPPLHRRVQASPPFDSAGCDPSRCGLSPISRGRSRGRQIGRVATHGDHHCEDLYLAPPTQQPPRQSRCRRE